MKLLTLGNQKTIKGEGRGYLTGVLHLAPFNLSGVNVCPMAELAGCVRACLNTAGRGGIATGGMVTYDSLTSGLRTNRVQTARVRRTRFYLESRDAFMLELSRDIERLMRKAARMGLTPCVRLNGTSDIRWEDIPCDGFPNIMARFPRLQFYDYTKVPNRRRALTVPNYHLTFSYSARPEFAGIVAKALENYGDKVGFAVVFQGKAPMPHTFLSRPVINGDETDLRFLDKPGCVIALKAKGNGRKDASGFAVQL